MSNPSQRHPRYLLRDQLDALHSGMARAEPAPVFDRVLVPLDGSPPSARILSVVRGLLARPGTEIMLLRVLSDSDVSFGNESTLEIACAGLESLRSSLETTGAIARYDLMTGEARERILTFAESYRPTLIAMATRGRGGLQRLIHGSVTEHLLRHVSCPVLAANPSGLEDAERHPGTLGTILCPLDGSELSAAVLPLVSKLARRHGATVVLVHAIEPLGLAPEFQVYEPAPEEGAAILEPHRLALRGQGIAVQTRVAIGGATLTIRQVAREQHADLVVMATHGRTGFSRLFFGSVAEDVLRSCPCPVLLERSQEQEEHAVATGAAFGIEDSVES